MHLQALSIFDNAFRVFVRSCKWKDDFWEWVRDFWDVLTTRLQFALCARGQVRASILKRFWKRIWTTCQRVSKFLKWGRLVYDFSQTADKAWDWPLFRGGHVRALSFKDFHNAVSTQFQFLHIPCSTDVLGVSDETFWTAACTASTILAVDCSQTDCLRLREKLCKTVYKRFMKIANELQRCSWPIS